MRYLNLGCGQRRHPDWLNLDVAPVAPDVLPHDVLADLPFPDCSFDAVYHSHLLEHLPRRRAPHLVKECFRVLRPAGTVRVAVPDLEGIARAYLRALDNAEAGVPLASAHHEWLVLELYDQAVREHSGGDMADYLMQDVLPDEAFVLQRCGAEARQILEARRARPPEHQHEQSAAPRRPSRREEGEPLKERLLRMLLGSEYELLEVARFRSSGEVHRWMYDRHSLGTLLREAGFTEVQARKARESSIAGWASYKLDADADGGVFKPDSLFMEARRPDA